METLRSMGVETTHDSGMLLFSLPEDLPFSADSVRRTLLAIAEHGFRRRFFAEFRPSTGMTLKVAVMPNSDIRAVEARMIDERVPLRVEQTERDQAGIDMVYTGGNFNSPLASRVMVDRAQVLTASQVRQYVEALVEPAARYCYLQGAELLDMWSLFLQPAGYFALGAVDAQGGAVLRSTALATLTNPRYGTCSISDVDLIMNEPGDAQSDITVVIHTQGVPIGGTPANETFEDMVDLLHQNLPAGFYGIEVPRDTRTVCMRYSGDVQCIQHPQVLCIEMERLLRPLFRVMRIAVADGCMMHVSYPNPPGFLPANQTQTACGHALAVESSR